jgi:hypothetical protein
MGDAPLLPLLTQSGHIGRCGYDHRRPHPVAFGSAPQPSRGSRSLVFRVLGRTVGSFYWGGGAQLPSSRSIVPSGQGSALGIPFFAFLPL